MLIPHLLRIVSANSAIDPISASEPGAAPLESIAVGGAEHNELTQTWEAARIKQKEARTHLRFLTLSQGVDFASEETNQLRTDHADLLNQGYPKAYLEAMLGTPNPGLQSLSKALWIKQKYDDDDLTFDNVVLLANDQFSALSLVNDHLANIVSSDFDEEGEAVPNWVQYLIDRKREDPVDDLLSALQHLGCNRNDVLEVIRNLPSSVGLTARQWLREKKQREDRELDDEAEAWLAGP
jgi:hypothetical protein